MIEGLIQFLGQRGVDFGRFATVFDIGSRDGRQSLELSKVFYQASVIAIECNPQTLDRCRRNVARNSRIRLIEKAVNSHTGRCKFFPIDPGRTVTSWRDGNPGASSLFVANGAYPIETYIQNEIEVECTRLDDLCRQLKIDSIDLLWMDLQGAELIALKSAGTLLDNVRYVYTEVSHRAIYAGQCLFEELDDFLASHGFVRCTEIDREYWQQNVIYAHHSELNSDKSRRSTHRDEKPALLPRTLEAASDPRSRALWLLFACARPSPSNDVAAQIRAALQEGVDWTLFAQKVLDHGLAPLCGHTLLRVAADLVPKQVSSAFRALIEQARTKNEMLFYELALLLDTLLQHGVEAIPFKGPALAVQAFGDIGLRTFRDLDFLIRDQDIRPAVSALSTLGYNRHGAFTEAQFETIHRLQGQEIIFKQTGGTAVEPHTRFGPITMGLDIDHEAMRKRARRRKLYGQSMLSFEPEDEFIILAVHGGKEMWWNIKWACDVAAFIESHGNLDWTAIEQRSRIQGCLRMVLLSAALAGRYFGSAIPKAICELQRADPVIEHLMQKVEADWGAGGIAGPPNNKTLSIARLRLHDGLWRRLRYIFRTLILPKPHHIGFVPVPAGLTFLYVPLRFFHDLIALPIYRVYECINRLARNGKQAGPDASQVANPASPRQWAARAQAFLDTNRVEEAIETNKRALAIDPKNVAALRVDYCAKMLVCDWRERNVQKDSISEALRSHTRLIAPVFHRALIDSEEEHFLLTQLWTKGFPTLEPLWRGERYAHDKIRIAYISTDFRSHVVSDVIIGCLEHHDRHRFETTAISLGPDDGSPMRRRVEQAFDRFIDAQNMQDADVAAAIRSLEIDVAIDLNGYSGAKRTGILARRPSPVQVNYLGYPGTVNASFIDYIIADTTIIPEESQRYFREKIAYLPDTFFPTDRDRPASADIPNRAKAGLPDKGVVFACHNAAHKIGPEIFDVWMRLLRDVDGSVLWLKAMPSMAMVNLRREANARGVAPQRLIFAPRLPRELDHLARLRLADIFLDTSPYNAHATASDALWVGVPVITCPSSTFPGRVAASLLRALEMPELVATSLAEYEALARSLALDPERLGVVKAKLSHKRETAPLFNTASFTRNLEAAYIEMWTRQQAGLPPTTFTSGRSTSWPEARP